MNARCEMTIPYYYERIIELAYQADKQEADYYVSKLLDEERGKVRRYEQHLDDIHYDSDEYWESDDSEIIKQHRNSLKHLEIIQTSLRLK